MNKILKALKSRTVWTVIVMFIISGVDGIREIIPSNALPMVEGILGLLAIYFRVNTRQ